jgi:hypothetical protein
MTVATIKLAAAQNKGIDAVHAMKAHNSTHSFNLITK